jgi:hypothetical protein
MTITHETEAQRLAAAYRDGDADARARVAEQCEESGLLGALVAARLRSEGLEDEFLGSMRRTLDDGRSR